MVIHDSESKEALVLIVDDDVLFLRGLTRLLRNQPFRIITARSGEEAQELLKRWPIHVIVCDEHMPGMSGTDLLAWIARHFPNTVRIVLTGQPDLPTAMKAINDGQVFRFLTKPCREFDLVMAIHEGLDSLNRQPSLPR
jgi:response regulator RpfG family c-di-GMP phosphodiesterase